MGTEPENGFALNGQNSPSPFALPARNYGVRFSTRMQCVAPSEKDSVADTMKTRLREAVVQARANKSLGGKQYFQRILGLGILLVWAAFCYSVHADSWLPPKPFDALSENGQFIAHVTPATKKSKAKVAVSAIKNHHTNEIWRAILSNDTAPGEVALWDEGTAIVTLDNWGRGGYGDDVVAIYGPSGLKAKYPLEELAPPHKPNPSPNGEISFSLVNDGYQDAFMHSTSSRHWRGYGISFFFRDASDLLYCLWLDWDNRWVAWQMADGKLRTVTPALSHRLDMEGRRRALQRAKTENFNCAALNFLGRLHHPEDRPLIETWLRDKEFSTGVAQKYPYDGVKPFLWYEASSYKRQEAEKILSCSDGIATNISTMYSVEHYRYLGTVKGEISLTEAPRKGDGTLRLYLIPATCPLEKWAATKPEHYLIADFDDDFPVEYGDKQIKDFSLTQNINFAICGVTAGDYRVKVVWNKNPPLTKSKVVVCRPHAGDYESVSSPMVSVKGGKVSEGVEIQCKTPFTAR